SASPAPQRLSQPPLVSQPQPTVRLSGAPSCARPPSGSSCGPPSLPVELPPVPLEPPPAPAEPPPAPAAPPPAPAEPPPAPARPARGAPPPGRARPPPGRAAPPPAPAEPPPAPAEPPPAPEMTRPPSDTPIQLMTPTAAAGLSSCVVASTVATAPNGMSPV